MNKQDKLKELEESHSQGIINEEELAIKKQELEKEQAVPEEINHSKAQEKENSGLATKTSEKSLIFIIIAIIIMFGAIFLGIMLSKESPKTIDDLHKLNYAGKLKPDQGYIYNGKYSFIKIEQDWYTQLSSASGKSIFDLGFRYGPKEVESIPIKGYLNYSLFNEAKEYYITYNPAGDYDPEAESFTYVVLAVNDFNQHMMKLYNKIPIAACDRNQTDICGDRPIITCNSTNKVVLYFKEGNEGEINVIGNCIIIKGTGFELVKAVDKILYVFYDIMPA